MIRIRIFYKRAGEEEQEITNGPIPLDVMGGTIITPIAPEIAGFFLQGKTDPDLALYPGDSMRAVFLPG